MKEYLDVVDKNKRFLGKKVLRGTELGKNEYNVIVKIWITNNENKILLTRRSANKPFPLGWECVGGCVIHGESSKEAIVRETKEEIGIDVSNEAKLVKTVLYDKQILDLYYANIDVKLDKLKLQLEEVCDVKFVSSKEFESMCQKEEIVPIAIDNFNIMKKRDVNE